MRRYKLQRCMYRPIMISEAVQGGLYYSTNQLWSSQTLMGVRKKKIQANKTHGNFLRVAHCLGLLQAVSMLTRDLQITHHVCLAVIELM